MPHRLGPMQTLPLPMRRFADNETVDYCIVGVGSAGGVLVQRLARAGFRVVALEAGPFWDTEKDWVSDEKGSHELYWNDLRITGGTHPLALGANNSGKGVGGGSVHWAAFTPRFHPSDFRVYTEDGVGADWPMLYWDLKPYYELLEREMPVAGPAWFPWGDPHGHPYGPHPLGSVGDVLVRGCTKLGIRSVAGGPVAILSASHGDRPHCIYRGFCLQGCKVGAKASTLITHVPDAITHGAEIRPHSMASRVSLREDGRVDGVVYFGSDGKEHFQKSQAVIVSGYAIETPRLLLNSACPGHWHGLANSSGTLGKYLMVQAGNVVCSAKLVHDRRGRVASHARSSDQMRKTRFLHDLLRSGRPHHLHHLVLSKLNQLLVIVMQIERDLCYTQPVSILLFGQLNPIVFPRQDLSQHSQRRPMVIVHHHTPQSPSPRAGCSNHLLRKSDGQRADRLDRKSSREVTPLVRLVELL